MQRAEALWYASSLENKGWQAKMMWQDCLAYPVAGGLGRLIWLSNFLLFPLGHPPPWRRFFLSHVLFMRELGWGAMLIGVAWRLTSLAPSVSWLTLDEQVSGGKHTVRGPADGGWDWESYDQEWLTRWASSSSTLLVLLGEILFLTIWESKLCPRYRWFWSLLVVCSSSTVATLVVGINAFERTVDDLWVRVELAVFWLRVVLKDVGELVALSLLWGLKGVWEPWAGSLCGVVGVLLVADVITSQVPLSSTGAASSSCSKYLGISKAISTVWRTSTYMH